MPVKNIRHANDRLKLLANDRNRDPPPPASATTIISPKPAVHPDGVIVAQLHVYLTDLDTILQIAHDVAAWNEILDGRTGREQDEVPSLVADAFTRRGMLPPRSPIG